jgi:uncharacterized DUF497 family protein
MVDFDPVKEAINLSKHRDRLDSGKPRFRAYGLLDGQPHCLVFTMRDDAHRPISLRRAHAK